MKLNRYFFLLSLIFLFITPVIPGMVIIKPFEGYFIEPNKLAGAHTLGWGGTFSALMTGQDTLQKNYFKTLNQLQERTHHPYKIFWHEEEAPEYIYRLLKGTTPNDILLEEVIKKINESAHIEQKELMKSLAQITFDPKTNAKNMQLNHDAIKLSKKLTQKGHRVIIADNYSGEAADRLRKKFVDDLMPIPMMISGEIKTIISPEFYKKLFAKFNFNANECILILTEEHYKPYAIEAGIPAARIIMYKSGSSISDTERLLKKQFHLAF
ncbi:MAG: hypothetical protein BWY54_00554 [Candidatus Dependentiae bacterium ADurb.Bin331]|nr:MAG: hypothetical protein BWY54_00554 [Candidatus Dependentiae bacterium ADurb.Bin331]